MDQAGEEGITVMLDVLVAILGASMMSYESVGHRLRRLLCHGVERGLAAVNAGDDVDTNGSICGNLCGAYNGAGAFPSTWQARVEAANR